METKRAQLAVIGAGPGGYGAAIRGAQLGLKTILVELDEDNLGGTCLNRGCIPTKCLLHTVKTSDNLKKQKNRGIIMEGEARIDLAAAVARSNSVISRLRKGIALLLKKNRVETVFGRGRLVSPEKVEVEGCCMIQSDHVILAAGGRPRPLPALPFDGELVMNTTHALNTSAPPGKAAVIGAGASGMEIGWIWAACGSSVTVIEILDQPLPFIDEEASRIIAGACRKRGIRIMTKTEVVSCEKRGSGVKLHLRGPGGGSELDVDRVLSAAGTQPNLEDLWSPEAAVEVEQGFVKTDETMRTSLAPVFAIGDLRGPPLLAHAAAREGAVAAEAAAGMKPGPYKPHTVPSVVYLHPQVAQVGIMEREGQEKGMSVEVGRFPFAASGMAAVQDETEGFVKVISDKKSGKIIGAAIVGPAAGELIGELATAAASGMAAEDFLKTIHPHPSLGEAIHESVLDIFGRAVHKV